MDVFAAGAGFHGQPLAIVLSIVAIVVVTVVTVLVRRRNRPK
jgi:hypothetical protein